MPGLLTLKTDLKSLKYGQDRPDGGSSDQPYIKTDINTVDSGFNRLRFTKFDDGFIRGGAVGALGSSVVDTLRIGKFLTDAPKGPLFIARQVGLQLTNPQLEAKLVKTDRPTSGQGFLNNALNFVANTAGKIENAVGPTRVYNLGVNTLAQVPVNALGGHILRHGFLPERDDSKDYINVVRTNAGLEDNSAKTATDYNRLLGLANNFNLGRWGTEKYGVTKKEQGVLNKLKGLADASPYGAAVFGAVNAIFNTNKEFEISNYIAGPGTAYGLGTTVIRRAMDSDTENKEKIDLAKGQSVALAGKTRDKDGNITELEFGLDRLLGASNFASSSIGRFYFVSNQSPLSNDDYYIPVNLNENLASIRDLAFKRTAVGDNINDIANNVYRSPSAFHGMYYVVGSGSNSTSHLSGSALGGLTPLDLPNVVYTGSGNSHIPYLYDVVNAVENLATNDPTTSPNIGIYAQLFNGQLNKERLPSSKIIPTYTNYYGDTVVIKAANGNGWESLTREKRVGSGRRDSLNLTPLFDAPAGSIGDTPPLTIPNTTVQTINDLVKFRIQAIDSNSDFASSAGNAKWMIFRAYITDLSDTVDATWNGVKYAGRGDQFYIYDGFSRKMSVSFKVAALSRYEMEPMYQKLNFLMSNLMPDYSTASSSQGLLMKGPMMRMTIGNWIDGQLCVLNSLSYKVSQETPWEIGLNDEELILPHIVDVTLNFTPIGSQTRKSNELPRKAACVSNIAQNWNGENEREYIKPCNDPAPPKPPKPDPVPDPAPKPTPNPKPVKKKIEIPPAYDQSIGTALTGINNPGKEPKFGSPAQEKAFYKARYGF